MGTLTGLVLKKIGRFLLGLGITGLAGFLGQWHGRRLARRGVTGENYFQHEKVGLASLLRLLVVCPLLVGLLVWTDRNTRLFESISPYLTQGSMVTLRSLLCFLLAVQWQIWADKTRLKKSLWILGIALIVFVTVEILILFPAFLLTSGQIDASGIIIQTTSTTCGPASLANILKMYGKNISETDVAIALKTGMTGTTDQEAAIGAKLLGFPDAAPCRPTLAEMLAEDLPLIVTIECDGVMHDVGLVGAASHTVIIADPLVGLVHYTHADFQAVYQKRGVKLGRPVFSQENPVRLSTFKPELFQKVIAPAGG